MRTSDILLTFFVLGIFFSLYFINISVVGIKSIKDNWDTYKCNPAIIPFAWLFGKDTKSNMMDCVDNIQGSSFADALLPFEYIFSLFTDAFSTQNISIGSSFSILNEIRSTIVSIFNYFVGFISNVILESQKILLVIRDTMKKCIAVVITFLHAINTMLTLTDSALNSTLVKTVFKLGDYVEHFHICFHPDTKLILNNNSIINISNLTINDTLIDNNKITSIHKLLNINKEYLYKINDILVTAHHYVKHNDTWIYVKDHPNSIKTTICPEYLYCIGTENNNITIHNTIFHDWNDDYIKDSRSNKHHNNCFHENSYIKMDKNIYKSIKNITIGDVLFDGTKVIGTNIYNNVNKLVSTRNKKIICDANQDIFYNNKFIRVEEHPNFIEYNNTLSSKNMYSIITTNHIIRIDNYTFKDSL
jgi:hypothetical protein